MIRKAEAFAEEMHRGQVDRAGVAYIEHPRHVAASVDGELEKVVALLHDTVEDTAATVEQLRELFGDDVADTVALLTHDKSVPYMDYIAEIGKNPVARAGKLAYLRHNMDLSRLPAPSEKDRERVEKYRKAYEALNG